MGWVESPPAFCAVTETIADLANRRIHRKHAPLHRLDQISETPTAKESLAALLDDETQRGTTIQPAPIATTPPPSDRSIANNCRPDRLAYFDIYVDDFIGLMQGSARQRKVAKRILFEAIDELLTPLERNPHQVHQEPTSVKKLKKGDGHWETLKVVLGWLLDTATQTVRLPSHRFQRLQQIFDELRGRKRCGIRQWQKYLGELRAMVPAIPGGKGLFSLLQHGLSHSDRYRVKIDRAMRDHLHDFERLAHSLHDRPTHLAELVPELPDAIGTHDASGEGMGGVWFVDGARPIVWRQRFPAEVRDELISFQRPHGSITNSDLELAGAIAHADVLARNHDVRHRSLVSLGDNTPTESWMKKGSRTTNGPAAYLLRLASFHSRHHRYHLQEGFIPGLANLLADQASRLFHLSDSDFLTQFNCRFPQSRPWQLLPLRAEMNSALISSLFRKPAALEPIFSGPPSTTRSGATGKPFAPIWESIPKWREWTTQFRSSKSSATDTAMAAPPAATTPSDIAKWKKPFAALDRRWPAWGPEIRA